MADRIKIDQATLLEAVIAHLCTELGIDGDRCLPVVDIMSPGNVLGGDWFLRAQINDGEFDGPMFDGGGNLQLNERTTLTVAGYVKTKLDPLGSDAQLLLETERGLLVVKKLILQGLSQQDVLSSASPFFRDLPQPVSCSAPTIVRAAEGMSAVAMGMIAVTFEISFDWDLT